MAKTYLKYNKPLPLIQPLVELIGDKKEVKMADIGSGPYSVIGSHLTGVNLEIYHSDSQDFSKFWDGSGSAPIVSIEYQNMENLTYEDNFFDIVHSQNALDHTRDAKKAVEEMIRVCKPDGWIYIKCWLNQLDTGHKHFWNAKEDGTFTNNVSTFKLKDFGFDIKFTDNGGESRQNYIVATLQKKI